MRFEFGILNWYTGFRVVLDMALGRTPHENYSYAYNNSVGQHYVTMLSNYIGPYPLEKLERHSRKDQRKVQVSRPSLIKTYNNAMGGVNLLMQQLEHMGHRSRGRSGGGHISQ